MTSTFPSSSRVNDFWRVNSYGYPCFFSDSKKSQEAWTTLLSFFDFSDYNKLKKYWSSHDAPRKLSAHAVESWKATFEEFGILYVESRSNFITITPAGEQIREAAEREDRNEFAWIGLNLLMRYPLRGPRRAKSDAHKNSDLLLYRFWYAALLDLDGYLWWTELERILCRVFLTSETASAIEDVRTMRKHPELLVRVNLPVPRKTGAFYNSLNQVAVHAGMNHLLLDAEDCECPYGVTEQKRRHSVRRDWLGMVRTALSNNEQIEQCSTGGLASARLPAAPPLNSEIDYFEYLGTKVAPLVSAAGATLSTVELNGEKVFFLRLDEHYRIHNCHAIVGAVKALCQLARGQRIVLSHDEHWTYLIENKELVDACVVRVSIRRARPISNFEIIRAICGEGNV